MIFELTDDIVFPDPRMGEEDGLLAVGGDLSVDRLLLAYSYGIFPWFSFRDWPYPAWYCPMKRFVIFPSEVHISHSMRTLMNKHEYRVTFNQDFEGVIHGCSEVEWNSEDELVGGLYGVAVGSSFIGESMFSKVASASKLALIHLAQFLQSIGGKMIDCQLETPHLRSMGGHFIPYEEYLEILNPGAYAALDR